MQINNPPTPELWISCLPTFSPGPGSGNYYYVRRFMLPAGTYTIDARVDDLAAFYMGVDFMSLEFRAFFELSDTPQVFTFKHKGGPLRLDFHVRNIPAQPTPSGLLFSLWSNGLKVYSTTAEGWWWDTKPIPDDALPRIADSRLDQLPVFSLMPNWKDGVRERLSWLTDVLESETGAEQRRALRIEPRRSVEASFLRKGAARAYIDSFLTGIGAQPFLMPLWFEALTMEEGVTEGAPGVNFVRGAGSQREWLVGDLAFINFGDPGNYEVLKVAEVTDLEMLWAEPPSRNWPRGTKIMPLREARIVENIKLDNITESVAESAIRFELIKPMFVPENWLANYNGNPLLPFKPNRADAVGGSYSRYVHELDNEVSLPMSTDLAEHTAVTLSMGLTLYGRSALWEFRQFLAAARGRARAFFAPTYTSDLEPVGATIPAGAILEVRATGLGLFHAQLQGVRSIVAITLAGQDMPSIFRIVTGVESQRRDNDESVTSVWRDRLMLQTALPELRVNQIARISFMAESRFDQDAFELLHVSNAASGVRTSIAVRQLRERRLRGNPLPPPVVFPV